MGATDEEWDAPSPVAHLGRRQRQVQHVADDGGRHDGHLLTPGLPRDVEALIARCGHLGEIDGDAAELDAGRKPLQEPPDQNQEGGEKTYGLVGGYERDQNRAKRHDAQCCNETLAASDPVDIGAEEDRAERSHQKACAERHEGQHQGRELIARGKEGLGYVAGVESEQEEVEHLEEVAARHPQDGGDL